MRPGLMIRPFPYAARSCVHRRALGDLVDDLLFRAHSDADDLGVFGGEFGEDGAIGRVMTGREHFLDEERGGDAAFQRAAMDGGNVFFIG